MAKLKTTETGISGLLIIEPKVFGDSRGFFMETYSKRDFFEAGITEDFVQDNHAKSVRGVLRGLHIQTSHSQGKLVRVTNGIALDVAVDLRAESVTYSKYFAVELSEDNKKMVYIPAGFAHGYLSISDEVEFIYKTTDYYYPEYDSGIRWNDTNIGVEWILDKYELNERDLILSEKDKVLPLFKENPYKYRKNNVGI